MELSRVVKVTFGKRRGFDKHEHGFSFSSSRDEVVNAGLDPTPLMPGNPEILKILVNHYQISAMMGMFELQWPAAVLNLFTAMGSVWAAGSEAASLACLVDGHRAPLSVVNLARRVLQSGRPRPGV